MPTVSEGISQALLGILKDELRAVSALLKWQTLLLAAIAVQLGVSIVGT